MKEKVPFFIFLSITLSKSVVNNLMKQPIVNELACKTQFAWYLG